MCSDRMDVDAAVSAEMTFNFALAFLQDDARTSLFPRERHLLFVIAPANLLPGCVTPNPRLISGHYRTEGDAPHMLFVRNFIAKCRNRPHRAIANALWRFAKEGGGRPN